MWGCGCLCANCWLCGTHIYYYYYLLLCERANAVMHRSKIQCLCRHAQTHAHTHILPCKFYTWVLCSTVQCKQGGKDMNVYEILLHSFSCSRCCCHKFVMMRIGYVPSFQSAPFGFFHAIIEGGEEVVEEENLYTFTLSPCIVIVNGCIRFARTSSLSLSLSLSRLLFLSGVKQVF